MENSCSSIVDNQYNTSDKLSKRISIHDKYSTNKMGFRNWIYSNYNFDSNMEVLELGCGTGDVWKGKIDELPNDIKLYLTDYSLGMVLKSKENLGEYSNIFYKTVNIEDIPFSEEKFDRVIANMMLYHVSDLNKALSEVSRVLKNDGYFYSATYGENRIVDYVVNLLGLSIEGTNKVFTLQNGYDILKPYFSDVIRLDYIDSLEITNLDDFLDYLYSLDGLSSITKIDRSVLKSLLSKKMVDGVLNIPKEYGMFICKK